MLPNFSIGADNRFGWLPQYQSNGRTAEQKKSNLNGTTQLHNSETPRRNGALPRYESRHSLLATPQPPAVDVFSPLPVRTAGPQFSTPANNHVTNHQVPQPQLSPIAPQHDDFVIGEWDSTATVSQRRTLLASPFQRDFVNDSHTMPPDVLYREYRQDFYGRDESHATRIMYQSAARVVPQVREHPHASDLNDMSRVLGERSFLNQRFEEGLDQRLVSSTRHRNGAVASPVWNGAASRPPGEALAPLPPPPTGRHPMQHLQSFQGDDALSLRNELIRVLFPEHEVRNTSQGVVLAPQHSQPLDPHRSVERRNGDFPRRARNPLQPPPQRSYGRSPFSDALSQSFHAAEPRHEARDRSNFSFNGSHLNSSLPLVSVSGSSRSRGRSSSNSTSSPCCGYCKALKLPGFETHSKANCPQVRRLDPCQICGAAGEDNHTETYCPFKAKANLELKEDHVRALDARQARRRRESARAEENYRDIENSINASILDVDE